MLAPEIFKKRLWCVWLYPRLVVCIVAKNAIRSVKNTLSLKKKACWCEKNGYSPLFYQNFIGRFNVL